MRSTVDALEKTEPGAFYFIENGEASFRDMTAAMAQVLGLGAPQPWPIDEAITELGQATAVYSLGSNSRVRGARARARSIPSSATSIPVTRAPVRAASSARPPDPVPTSRTHSPG